MAEHDYEGLPMQDIAAALRAAQADHDNVVRSGTFPVLQLLAGAAMGLAQAGEFRRQHLAAEMSDEILVPNDADLGRMVADMLEAPREMSWSSTPMFRIWSLGFFLNKAQENIAAALDRLLNQWLVARFGIGRYEPSDPREDISWLESLMHQWMGDRVGLIAHLSGDASVRTAMDALYRAFVDCSHTRTSGTRRQERADAIKKAGNVGRRPPLEYTRPECLAIVCGRVNRFKHRPESQPYAGGFGYFAGMEIVSTAILGLDELWIRMREDTRQYWDKVEPPRNS